MLVRSMYSTFLARRGLLVAVDVVDSNRWPTFGGSTAASCCVSRAAGASRRLARAAIATTTSVAIL